MYSFLALIHVILEIYVWVLIAWVILSWLIAFDVINTRNRFVYAVSDFLYRVTEPALKPIRRVVPTLGGVDLSPLILMLAIWFVQNLIYEYLG